MKRIMLFIGPALILAGCRLEFDPNREYKTVADCYGTFLALGLEAEEPALGYDLARQQTLADTALESFKRMQPYSARSAVRAGGEQAFLTLSTQTEASLSLDKFTDDQAKRDAFMAIAAKADACHDKMTGWGAPPRQATPTPEPEASAQTAPARSPPPSPR